MNKKLMKIIEDMGIDQDGDMIQISPYPNTDESRDVLIYINLKTGVIEKRNFDCQNCTPKCPKSFVVE